MVKKIPIKKKTRPYIYFSIVVVTLLVMLYVGFSSTLSNYLHNQITEEAVALAKSNGTTILTLDTSVKAVHDLLVNQLRNVAEILVNTSSPSNIARNEVLGGNHLVDEINWVSNDGIILYSSKDYEGDFFPEDHFLWTFMNSDQDYAVEDVREDVYTNIPYLHLYMKADDDTIIQVGILADRIVGLTQQFSIENIMAKTLENEQVVEAVAYIDVKSKALSSVYGDMTYNLTDEQLSFLKSNTELSRMAKRNGENVLEVYTSLNDEDGNHIGSFLLIYSLTSTESFVQTSTSSILAFLSMITLVFLTLTLILYRRERQIIAAPYTDHDTNILNIEYIRENYDMLQETNTTDNSTIAVFLISNYRRAQLLNTHDVMISKLNRLVGILKRHSENDEVYRYQDDIFFLLSHNRSHDAVMDSIQRVLKDIDFNFEIRTTLIEGISKFDSVETLFDSFKVTSMQLKNSQDASEIVVTDNIGDELIKRQVIERDLRLLSVQGFANQLYVVFHPQIDIESGEVVGFETLTRWIHPEYGFISPPLIFEIAESSDYYNALTRWILTQALEFIQKLNEEGYTKPIVSINAPNEYILLPDCIHNVRSIMEHYNVSPSQVGFEITESTFDDSIDLLRVRVAELNALGITTYIDDYGRGYSSMVRLRDLDVNVLKIDKTFVDDINKDERFLNSIIAMANELNLEIVAEGAEREEQVAWLRENNCNVIQGFYFSKPLKFEDAIQFMNNFKQSNSTSDT